MRQYSIKFTKNSLFFYVCAHHRGTVMWLTQMTRILLEEQAREAPVEY